METLALLKETEIGKDLFWQEEDLKITPIGMNKMQKES